MTRESYSTSSADHPIPVQLCDDDGQRFMVFGAEGATRRSADINWTAARRNETRWDSPRPYEIMSPRGRRGGGMSA